MNHRKIKIQTIIITFIMLLSFGIYINDVQSEISLDAAITVKVGLLTPQTGNLSPYSSGFENAAALAIKQLNEDPSTNTSWIFQLSIYDTQSSETAASAAMTQAITDGMDYVVGAAGSSQSLAAASIATAYEIPQISYASTSPDLSTFDDHAIAGDEGYLWRTAPTDALQGRVISDVAKQGGYQSMVIAALDNVYGSGLATAVKNEFTNGTKAGIVLNTTIFSESESDFTNIVAEIKVLNPDVIVVVSYFTPGSKLLIELTNQEVNKPIIGADGVSSAGIFSESAGTKDAMQYMVGIVSTGPTSKESTWFKNNYTAAYPGASGEIYTAETFDAVMVGAKAVMAAGSTVGSNIIAQLALTNYEGASGHIEFDSNGDRIGAYYSVREVQNGQFVEVGTWNGTLDLGSFIQKAVPNGTLTEVKVGFLAPYSGWLSSWINTTNAAQLAITDLNLKYPSYKFKLYSYDTKSDSSATNAAITQAIVDGMHFVVGASASMNTLSAANIATTNKIPLISYSSTSPELSTFNDHAVVGDEGYLWRTVASDAFQTNAMVDLAKAGGYSKAVIVIADDPSDLYGQWISDAFKARFISGPNAGSILDILSIWDTDIINKITTLSPDLIVIGAFDEDIAKFLEIMDAQNLHLPVIATALPGIFSKVSNQDVLQHLVSILQIIPSTPSVVSFLNKYAAAYPGDTNKIYIGETYDAVMVGAEAIVRANSLSGPDIIVELAKTNYDGGSGHIAFDVNGDIVTGSYDILEVQNNVFAIVGDWTTSTGLNIGSFKQQPIGVGGGTGISTIVKIGFLLPQTGNYAQYSSSFESGAKLALEDLKTMYPDYSWEVHFYDTKSDTEGAITAMQMAIAEGMVFVAGPALSVNLIEIFEIGKSSKIPIISYSATSPEITDLDDHADVGDPGYVWRVIPSDAHQARAMFDIAKLQGFTRIAIVTENSTVGRGITNEIKALFQANPTAGSVVREIILDINSQPSSILDDVISSKPDVLILLTFDSIESGKYLESLAGMDFDLPVIASEYAIKLDGLSQSLKNAIEHLIVLRTISQADQAFLNRFTSTYPSVEVNYVPEAYDSIMVGVKAIIASNSTDGHTITKFLQNTSYYGVSGLIEFDINGDRKGGMYEINEIHNGNYVKVGSWDDGVLSLPDFTQQPIGGVITTSSSTSSTSSSSTTSSSLSKSTSSTKVTSSETTSTSSPDDTSTITPDVDFPYFSLFAMFLIIPIIIRKIRI